MKHLRTSETTTAVEERYRGPGRMREYLIVSTRAEFWTTRTSSETYLVGSPNIVEVAAMLIRGCREDGRGRLLTFRSHVYRMG